MDPEEAARQALLEQLSEMVRRKLTPHPASRMPAVDRALGDLRRSEPDASQIDLMEMPWQDPALATELANTHSLLKNRVTINPAFAAVFPQSQIEGTLRHELEHLRDYQRGEGMTPVSRQRMEDRAYAAEDTYKTQRGIQYDFSAPNPFDLFRDLVKRAGR